MPLPIDLTGAGCVVLGAGAGIGAATCRALAAAGARVLCIDRDAALAEAIAIEVDGVAQPADIRSGSDVEALFAAAVDKLGRPLRGIADIVGVATTKRLSDIDEPAWDAQFDIVLRHAYHTLRYAGRALGASGGGSMVFVGSLAGNLSVPNQVAYGAAKAALHHMVRTAAHELGPSGVRVNAVAPGIVRTPRLAARLPEALWQRFEEVIPLRRVATPEDVAGVIAFLLADVSGVISGTVIPVDGALGTVSAVPEFRM